MNALELLAIAPPEAQRQLKIMQTAFATEGIEPERFLRHISDSVRSEIADPQMAIFDAWVRSYRDEFPPLSALFAGQRVPFGAYHVIDYLASSCHDVAQGFERLGRYFTLVRPEVQFVVEDAGAEVTVSLVDRIRSDDFFFDEWSLGATMRGFRETLGSRFAVLRFGIRRPDPRDPALVRRAEQSMGGPPVFAADSASLTFSREVWQETLPASDSRLRETLERHARELMAEVAANAPTSKRVRELLSSELSGGQPTIDRVAKLAAVTPRTLQRRLADEGQTFQSVLDALRAELAERYLVREKLGVSEVAFMLGYADASAFARAHRRWFGKAPGERRDQT
jgi:AraC-like DNA-binding protein